MAHLQHRYLQTRYQLQNVIKQGQYIHFWKDRTVVAVFKDKIFEFDYNNKGTWKDAVDYGLSLGIQKEQLDFPIDLT